MTEETKTGDVLPPEIGEAAHKIINASMIGTVQLHIQEAHWIANAAAQQAAVIEQALAANQVPIAAIRESEAMAHGLRNLSQKAVRAFQELAQHQRKPGESVS